MACPQRPTSCRRRLGESEVPSEAPYGLCSPGEMPPRENAGLRLQTWFTEEYDNTPELRRREEELRPLKDFAHSPDIVE